MRQRGKRRYYSGPAFVIALCVAGGLAIGTTGFLRHTYENRLNETEQQMLQNTRTVFVALCDIKAGELVTETLLEKRTALCSQAAELLFSEEDIGNVAVVPIKEGSFLNKCFVSASGPVENLREMSYRGIELTGNVSSYDVVDVRIRYPTGEDYIVLSGKRVRLDDTVKGTCYLRVDEEEILLMSAAIADAERNEGVRIYTSRYLEPSLQNKSEVTYYPTGKTGEPGNRQ